MRMSGLKIIFLVAQSCFLCLPSTYALLPCKEAIWCPTAPSTKQLENGEENPGCRRWVKDCPCSCALTKDAVEKEEDERRRQEDEEQARIAARDKALWMHVEQQTRPRNDSQKTYINDVKLSILVRTQHHSSDINRTDYFRKLQQKYPHVLDIIFLSDLSQPAERGNGRSPAGFWTIIPYISHWLYRKGSKDAHWFVVAEPWTQIDVPIMRALLSYYDNSKPHFLGRAFQMRMGVITLQHDFRDLNIAWPDSSFALSHGLMELFVEHSEAGALPKQKFFVTWERELAHSIRKATDVILTHLPAYFCTHNTIVNNDKDNELCATTSLDKYQLRSSFNISYDDIVIFVKTTQDYHAQRLDILRNTWAKDKKKPVEIVFASDAKDAE